MVRFDIADLEPLDPGAIVAIRRLGLVDCAARVGARLFEAFGSEVPETV